MESGTDNLYTGTFLQDGQGYRLPLDPLGDIEPYDHASPASNVGLYIACNPFDSSMGVTLALDTTTLQVPDTIPTSQLVLASVSTGVQTAP